MPAKTLFALLSVPALGSYTVGRYSRPVNHAPVSAVVQPQPLVAKPVAFAAPPVATAATPSATGNSVPTIRMRLEKAAHAVEKPAPAHRGDPHQAAGGA